MQASTTRRRFHLGAIYSLWGLITGALGVPAFVYLLFPPKAKKADEWVEVGQISSLPSGAPEEVIFRRVRKDGWKTVSERTSAWVMRQGDKEVIAFAPQCTHLGCAYHWEDAKKVFVCPCHTSAFSPSGDVLTGPAPRALDRYQVRVEGDKVLLGQIVRGQEG